MQGRILGLLAETHLHPGAGQSEQAIDLPVARERTTCYPFVPGSGVKGALRALAERRLGKKHADIDAVYGKADDAGDLLVSDARLLLLPVRCLSRAYLWLTCPYLLERWRRDRARALGDAGPEVRLPELDAEEDVPAILCRGTEGERLFLEERLFRRTGELPEGFVELVAPLVGEDRARARLPRQMALVSDDEFGWFARFALPVHAHNALDENKTSTSLWYEETLAPDTLLYVVAMFRAEHTRAHLDGLFREQPFLQLGGNETTGQGWCRVAQLEGGER